MIDDNAFCAIRIPRNDGQFIYLLLRRYQPETHSGVLARYKCPEVKRLPGEAFRKAPGQYITGALGMLRIHLETCNFAIHRVVPLRAVIGNGLLAKGLESPGVQLVLGPQAIGIKVVEEPVQVNPRVRVALQEKLEVEVLHGIPD